MAGFVMLTALAHVRADGSFVGMVNGFRYHITPGDRFWNAAQDMHAANPAPDEPVPEPPTEAELLAEERAGMRLTRLQFGLQSLAAGLMTAAEAEGFLGPRTVPQVGEDALLRIEDAALRVVARMRLVGFERLERSDPFLVPFQAEVDWTDAQVDDFFRAGMLL